MSKHFTTAGTAIGSYWGPAGAVIGGGIGQFVDVYEGRSDAADQKRVEYERQKEFAQSGIRWKVEDAKAAGIHPLYALGGGGASYSPAQVVGGSDDSGAALMGQNIKRAMDTGKTADERAFADAQLQAILTSTQKDVAQTGYWLAMVDKLRTPPTPEVATPPTGAIQMKPSKSVSAAPGAAGREAATTPAMKRFNLGGGAYVDLPGQEAAESLESMGTVASAGLTGIYAARRWWHGPDQKPTTPLPPGYEWHWAAARGAFIARKIYDKKEQRQKYWPGPAGIR